jgi:hypothetical protein
LLLENHRKKLNKGTENDGKDADGQFKKRKTNEN